MQFNLNDLKELLSCIKNNNLRYVSIKQDKFELVINKEIVSINKYKVRPSTEIVTPTRSKTLIKPSQKQSNEIQAYEPNNRKDKDLEIYFTIVSPMVGTFYRSPAPHEPYFIQLNDHVKINQTVCIVEAMKLMNEIEAEISGQIVEILVKDGDIVDCGQPLMRIKPD
uniref:Biotin carboxyl carrier protein of acetyl-CoA carboxylase n=1 Tax=Liagoropsis maxima TaxID=1653392 RepID=A0A1G4NWD3_9FLOR|nr:Acetyl-CoA carboxylase, biotin carboxyl carrier protein [Liagoropsis maxima]SCW22809.1 Acetyl-CoA carboxylase, biotin carboxyl carrier protein [Liagoropsis maxima]